MMQCVWAGVNPTMSSKHVFNQHVIMVNLYTVGWVIFEDKLLSISRILWTLKAFILEIVQYRYHVARPYAYRLLILTNLFTKYPIYSNFLKFQPQKLKSSKISCPMVHRYIHLSMGTCSRRVYLLWILYYSYMGSCVVKLIHVPC